MHDTRVFRGQGGSSDYYFSFQTLQSLLWDLVNMIMNLVFHKRWAISLLAEQL